MPLVLLWKWVRARASHSSGSSLSFRPLLATTFSHTRLIPSDPHRSLTAPAEPTLQSLLSFDRIRRSSPSTPTRHPHRPLARIPVHTLGEHARHRCPLSLCFSNLGRMRLGTRLMARGEVTRTGHLTPPPCLPPSALLITTPSLASVHSPPPHPDRQKEKVRPTIRSSCPRFHDQTSHVDDVASGRRLPSSPTGPSPTSSRRLVVSPTFSPIPPFLPLSPLSTFHFSHSFITSKERD